MIMTQEQLLPKKNWKKPSLQMMVIFVSIALIAIAIFSLHYRYQYTLNLTESLPEKLFIIDTKDQAHHSTGNYIGMAWKGGWGYPKNAVFVKIIAGQAGDKITVKDRFVFVNGELVGYAKPKNRGGIPLPTIQEQVIPPHKLFVKGSHMNSFDSRYADFGLIDEEQIIGHAHGFF